MTKSRSVTVFVASVFHDMRDERELLHKVVFPRLREQLRFESDIDFNWIDPAWTATNEDELELGELLEAIDRCRPFFIALVGELYGAPLEYIPEQAARTHPWLQDYVGCSRLAIEVFHGALVNPSLAAAFYFRDPRLIDSLPPTKQESFRDDLTHDEIARVGPAEAALRAEARANKLNELKDRIRESGHLVRENYSSLRALGEMIFDDLHTMIMLRSPRVGEVVREASAPFDLREKESDRVGRPETEPLDGARTEAVDELDDSMDSRDTAEEVPQTPERSAPHTEIAVEEDRSGKRDYYAVLGVPRDVTEQDLKQAYRRLAVKYHPDRNPGDKNAEERFMELAEAYSVLSSPDLRSRYDRFGHAGVSSGRGGGAAFGDDFAGFNDTLGDLFDFGDAMSQRRGRGPRRGSDLRYDIEMTPAEAAAGLETRISVRRLENCEFCNGTGASEGSPPTRCSTCAGTGQVKHQQGFFSVTRICSSCRGTGRSIANACQTCRGEGRVARDRTIDIKVPAGVTSGSRVRIAGEGEAGELGVRSGDLYITITVKERDIAISQPAGPSAERDQPAAPYLDENVQFTVYRPKTIQPSKWYSMVAFAHLAERRPDADEDEPDPIEEVERQAGQILGEKIDQYHDVRQDSRRAVPREAEITFVPDMPGIEFNPPRRSLFWLESVHREEFHLRASPTVDGQTVRGYVSVYLGRILIAEVSLSIQVNSRHVHTSDKPALLPAGVRPYRKIFASYSHKDIEIVEQFDRLAQAFGDEYLRDLTHLRAGEVWSLRLEEMITDANVFQLFWSSNSMTSQFVKEEWEYALSLRRRNFVRPTYWEDPLPEDPAQELPPEALRELHFKFIGAAPRPVLRATIPPARPPTVESSPPAHSVGESPSAYPTAPQMDRFWEERNTAEMPRSVSVGRATVEQMIPMPMSASGDAPRGRLLKILIAAVLILIAILVAIYFA